MYLLTIHKPNITSFETRDFWRFYVADNNKSYVFIWSARCLFTVYPNFDFSSTKCKGYPSIASRADMCRQAVGARDIVIKPFFLLTVRAHLKTGGTAVFCPLTFRHRASCILDRRFTTLQRTLFIYLINKYISLSDICLTVRHWYK